jgi:hypothetical protein
MFIDDALKQGHERVYQTTLKKFIRGSFENIAPGSTGYERARTVFLRLITLLNDMSDRRHIGSFMKNATEESLLDLA